MHALLISLCGPRLLQLGLAPPTEHKCFGISGLSNSCILACGGIGFAAGLIVRFLPGSFFDFFLFLLWRCFADSHPDSRKKESEGCGTCSGTLKNRAGGRSREQIFSYAQKRSQYKLYGLLSLQRLSGI